MAKSGTKRLPMRFQNGSLPRQDKRQHGYGRKFLSYNRQQAPTTRYLNVPPGLLNTCPGLRGCRINLKGSAEIRRSKRSFLGFQVGLDICFAFRLEIIMVLTTLLRLQLVRPKICFLACIPIPVHNSAVHIYCLLPSQ